MPDHPTGGHQGPDAPAPPAGAVSVLQRAQFSAPVAPPPLAPVPHVAAAPTPSTGAGAERAGIASRGLIAAMALISAVLAFTALWPASDGVTLMGWAYWLTLVLGTAMTFVPAHLDRSAH